MSLLYELELKAKADLDTTRALLKDISAEYKGADNIVDTYYDTPSFFHEGRDEALRIRSARDGTSLCFKGRDTGGIEKNRREFESDIDLEAGHAILAALGFVRVGVVAKHRETYTFDNMTICLDSVQGIGDFVEIEMIQHFDSKQAKERLFEFAEALGLSNFVKESYIRMLQTKVSRKTQ